MTKIQLGWSLVVLTNTSSLVATRSCAHHASINNPLMNLPRKPGALRLPSSRAGRQKHVFHHKRDYYQRRKGHKSHEYIDGSCPSPTWQCNFSGARCSDLVRLALHNSTSTPGLVKTLRTLAAHFVWQQRQRETKG